MKTVFSSIFPLLLLVDFDRFMSDLSGNKQANSAETGA